MVLIYMSPKSEFEKSPKWSNLNVILFCNCLDCSQLLQCLTRRGRVKIKLPLQCNKLENNNLYQSNANLYSAGISLKTTC